MNFFKRSFCASACIASQLQFSNGAVGRPKALVNGGWGDARDVALCKAFGKGQQLDAYVADAGR